MLCSQFNLVTSKDSKLILGYGLYLWRRRAGGVIDIVSGWVELIDVSQSSFHLIWYMKIQTMLFMLIMLFMVQQYFTLFRAAGA